MTFSLEFGSCSKDPETCTTLAQTFEYDEFCAAMEGLDPTATEGRRLLGKVFVMCARGNCPGQNPELANQVFRKLSDPRD